VGARVSGRRRSSLLVVVLVLWLVSVGVRFAMYDSQENVVDLDATYHVLLTVQAYRETPVSVHRFWPLVTLGTAPERGVPFGTTVPDDHGIYYYTSFAPAGFLAPYLFFQITRLPLTPVSLMLFNLGIHLAATVLLCLLVRDVLRALAMSDDDSYAPIIFAAATYLFSTESLFSHGLIYWHHSLFQVVWLGQLCLFFMLLRSREANTRVPRWFTPVFLGMAFLAPSVEWAGYIGNMAIAGWLLWSARAMAIGVLAATVVAGIAFLAHATSIIGLEPLVASLGHSFHQRGRAHGSLALLALGYVQSYFLLPLFALAAPLIVRARRAGGLGLTNSVVALIVVGTIPLVENLLLLQHATEYNFDRLKALIPICLLGAIALALAGGVRRRALAVVWAALLVVNVANRPGRTRDLTVALGHSAAVLRALDKDTKPCTLYAVNSFARGWVYLTLHHNVAENVVSPDSLRVLTLRHRACQGVLLIGGENGNQIYDWTGALVFDPPDRVRTLIVRRAGR
jgi:hypothetical protein